MLLTIAHSIMVHERVLEAYINFHILLVIPTKDLIIKYGKTTMPFKPVTGKKPLVSHLRVLFFTCVVCKSTAHVGTKALNIFHQAQKGF